MKVHNNIDSFPFGRTVITVGVFDGLHLGHRVITNMLLQEAKALSAESVVFTLHPHPKTVLFPEQAPPKCLMTPDEKIAEAEKIGIDHLVLFPFSKEFGKLTACEFIREILINKLKAVKLIVGYDHRFGSDRQSDICDLRACAEPLGCKVQKAEAFIQNGNTLSSTLIRELLLQGEIKAANRFLSYPYRLSGTVISGDRIGRKLGFPTANLKVHEAKLLPARGVYAVYAQVDGVFYEGMLNIGKRPTVSESGEVRVEVHLFDCRINLYGKEVSVYPEAYVRKEKRFENTEALKKQLLEDKKIVLDLLHSKS